MEVIEGEWILACDMYFAMRLPILTEISTHKNTYKFKVRSIHHS
jgi:hypothetical protein